MDLVEKISEGFGEIFVGPQINTISVLSEYLKMRNLTFGVNTGKCYIWVKSVISFSMDLVEKIQKGFGEIFVGPQITTISVMIECLKMRNLTFAVNTGKCYIWVQSVISWSMDLVEKI